MVPYREERGTILYLVISSAVTKREHWEFPKGGVEEGERETETALRELREETGVTDVRLLPGFREPIRYIYRRPEGLVSKQVVYFIGKVRDPKVVLRIEEAKDYRWATYEETYKLIRHANARVLLERSHAYITGKPLPERPQRQGRQPSRRSSGGDRSRSPNGARRSASEPSPARRASPESSPRAQAAAPAGQAAATAPSGEAQAKEASPPGEAQPRRRRRRRRRRNRKREG